MKKPVAEHTPGPWILAQGPGTCFHEGNELSIFGECDVDGKPLDSYDPDVDVVGFAIAEVWPTSDGSDLADARLIAAAPDLLEALRDCLNWANSRDGSPETDETNLRQIAEISETAIDKASGTA